MLVSVYRVPFESLSLALGGVGYGNDHLTHERAKFYKLESDCKETSTGLKPHCLFPI